MLRELSLNQHDKITPSLMYAKVPRHTVRVGVIVLMMPVDQKVKFGVYALERYYAVEKRREILSGSRIN